MSPTNDTKLVGDHYVLIPQCGLPRKVRAKTRAQIYIYELAADDVYRRTDLLRDVNAIFRNYFDDAGLLRMMKLLFATLCVSKSRARADI